MKRTKKFAVNAAILTLSSLLMQGVSMAFNIYLSNRVGAEGIGLFTLIMSVNGLAVTFATSGVHLATVRLVSEAEGKGSDNEKTSALKRCFVYGLLFGSMTALLMFFSAGYIGKVWLADERTVKSIRILALSLPFVSLCSVMSGYFSAVRRVTKSAAMNIVDEIVSIAVVSIMIRFLLPKGTEYACIAIIGGTCTAQVISFVYMLVVFLFDLRKHNTNTGPIPNDLTRSMLKITLPVAFTAYAKSGLSTIKNLLVPYSLKKSGISSTAALEAYGMLTGMAMPVVMFPQVITGSFAGLLVPEITNSRMLGHYNNIRYVISRVYHIVIAFSVGVCGMFICFAPDFGEVIYSDSTVSEYIRLMAPLAPFLYTDGIVDAILNGLDQQLHSMRINLLDSTVSIILVFFIVPVWGAYGYIVMLYICKTMNAVLSFARLVKVTGLKVQVVKWFVKPALCIATAVLAVNFISAIFGLSEHINVFTLAAKVVFSATLYFVFLRISGQTNNEDWQWMVSVCKG